MTPLWYHLTKECEFFNSWNRKMYNVTGQGPSVWRDLPNRKEAGMNVTLRYMLRPVAHCKEGCSIRSRTRL
jgi:hypothetical protein